jgi:FkbM family methyltransferase
MFMRYVRGPDHPCKLRLLNHAFRFCSSDLLTTTESGTMLLNPKDLIQRALLQYGHFEPATAALIQRLVRHDSVFVDVGANVGSHALRAARCITGSGRVVAIEASPAAFDKLIVNLSLNEHGRRISPILCAVAAETGLSSFVVPSDENLGQGHLVSAEKREAAFTVATVRLVQILEHVKVSQVDVLKIDIEGHESDVLSDLFDSGMLPTHVICEYLPDAFQSHGRLLQVLRNAGYVINDVSGHGYEDAAHVPENNLWAVHTLGSI